MSKYEVELNSDAVKELLKSPEIEQICREHAERAREACGDGYKSDSYVGKNRVNAMVWADSPKAKRDNAKHNTILKALKAK